MQFPFFTGKQSKAPETPVKLPVPKHEFETRPQEYDTSPELAKAVNVALMMGQPLVVTGEPGTGKTQLAYRVAWELGFGTPLKFETKSTSVSKDLFYTFNALDRFHDASCNQPHDAKRYITYRALGKAIILALEPEEVKNILPEAHFKHDGPRRSVVLIDEIDKAPLDFPNDILNEIENFYFRIPELGNRKIEAPKEMSPVVIITSNSEKHLPDPFLRRCVYHHIRFPERERLEQIVAARLSHIPTSKKKSAPQEGYFLEDAVSIFFALRDLKKNQSKKPSTSELIAWMQSMREMSEAANPIREDRECAVATLGTMVKTGDMADETKLVRNWTPDR